MYPVYLNQAAGAYLFLLFFNFLSLQFQNINIFVILFLGTVRPTKLKLDVHMGNGVIYCVYQNQAMGWSVVYTKIVHICSFFFFFFFSIKKH